MPPKTHSNLVYLVGAVCLVAGLCMGYFLKTYNLNDYLSHFKPYRVNDSQYTFISPLVGIDSPSSLTIGINVILAKRLKDMIADYKTNSGVQEASVYYRDLNSSSWFGIDENNSFIPASLLKITYALGAYKENEDHPTFFSKRIMYTSQMADLNASIPGAQPSVLQVGRDYSVKELVSIMLLNSDNGARDILAKTVDTKYVNQLYSLLGVKDPNPQQTYTISAKDYSLFLRILYSATFLNNRDSEDVLNLLHNAHFVNGLVAGVPSTVSLAHKFGLYSNRENGKELYIELHDCGIIYHPVRPYILCVMTRGTNQASLQDLIADISREVYQNVDHQ